jgi:hypothetical protein
MYSFDAWSFGAMEMERERRQNGGHSRYWTKSIDVSAIILILAC